MFGNKGEEQPRFPKVWFIWNLIEALLMVAAGGLAIYFGITKDNGNGSTGPIETTIAAVIGAFIILDGILRILMVLFRYKESQESIWLVGGFEITAGIVVILSHEFFVGLIINFLSVFLMVIGGLLLLFSVLSIVRKAEKLFMPVLEIIFGALLLALGVAIMIMYKNADMGEKVVLIVIGIVMAAFGLTQAIIAIISFNKKKKQMAGNLPAEAPKHNKPKKHKKTAEEEEPDPIEGEIIEQPVSGELDHQEPPEPLQIEEKK